MSDSSEHVMFMGDRKLYGRLFVPDEPNGTGILLLNSLFSEANYSRTFLINMGRWFCQVGYRVLYLDYSGQGESPGDASTLSASTLCRDTQAGIDFLSEAGPLDVVLVGFRGGAIPSLGHAASPAVKLTVLWEPVKSGKELIRFRNVVSSASRESKKDNRLVDIGGWRINSEFLQEMQRWDMNKATSSVPCDRLLVVDFVQRPEESAAVAATDQPAVLRAHVSSRKFWYLGYQGYPDYTDQAARITDAFIQARRHSHDPERKRP